MAKTTIEIPKKIYREIEEISNVQNFPKEKILNRVLSIGLEGYILELYKDRKISLRRMAELLNINMWEMIDKIKKSGLFLHYGEKELKEDLSD